eukprot:m.195587 g.195587  ORF g.195587 m.195587 type:complete len:304 (+) comp18680_c0_seq2:69-980(+)
MASRTLFEATFLYLSVVAVCTKEYIPPAAPVVNLAPGVDLPMVGMGTGSGQHGDVANATALWLGQTNGVLIDTAYDYEDEASIATGITLSGAPRSQIFLETKIPCSSYTTAKRNIQDNLDQLQMKAVDLTLIHFNRCMPGSSVAETWKALEEAQAAGMTRSIGVSHFLQADIEELMKTATTKPVLNQCELSVSYHDDATMEYCRAKGIVYQAFSPLCGGFNGSSCSARGGKNVLTVPEVKAIALAHNVSAAQVGLKWIVQQGYPLVTAIWNVDYMNEDLDLWSWGNLTQTEMKTLSSVYKPKF